MSLANLGRLLAGTALLAALCTLPNGGAPLASLLRALGALAGI